jgi:hypothetical protein
MARLFQPNIIELFQKTLFPLLTSFHPLNLVSKMGNCFSVAEPEPRRLCPSPYPNHPNSRRPMHRNSADESREPDPLDASALAALLEAVAREAVVQERGRNEPRLNTQRSRGRIVRFNESRSINRGY